MSKSLNQMIQENYIEQIKRKEAEIKMLHFQINPHFLYNTLNLISSLAVLDEKKKIMLITNSMAELFRYNMQGEYKVRVENELHVIKQYISIQELRFPKKFHVCYEIDSNLLQCEIGKFTLQPIVENIFKHNSLKDKLEIRIIVKREDENTFTISVWDSGAGIEPNHLESLNKQLQGTNSESDVTIGIFNVNSRIKRRAGDGYGMRISSQWGAWTEVVMTLPI